MLSAVLSLVLLMPIYGAEKCSSKIETHKLRLADVQSNIKKSIQILKESHYGALAIDLSAVDEDSAKFFQKLLNYGEEGLTKHEYKDPKNFGTQGFKVLDIEVNAVEENDRWNQIRDRLNRYYAEGSRKWVDNGDDATTGSFFIKKIIQDREINKNYPIVLFFNDFVPSTTQPDPVATWLESLPENIINWDYKYSGLIKVVIASKAPVHAWGSKNGFQHYTRLKP